MTLPRDIVLRAALGLLRLWLESDPDPATPMEAEVQLSDPAVLASVWARRHPEGTDPALPRISVLLTFRRPGDV